MLAVILSIDNFKVCIAAYDYILADCILLKQILIALRSRFSEFSLCPQLSQLCFFAVQRRLRVLYLCFKYTGIDLYQQIAFFDNIPLFYVNIVYLT